ncbi:MAG: transcriptional repressor NrdR [Spartobacteria bacterium]|nr:transcriptional repressor NrdR [Spartobacteria bacterium]
MRCPKCSSQDDKVVDSRTTKNGDVIRRRRMCLHCSHRYTTYEEVVKSTVRVVKRDGAHQELSKQKMYAGVLRACEKRPLSVAQVEALIDDVINEIDVQYDREVPSTVIGEKIMKRLAAIDDVAYVRFASVYRRFKKVSEFIGEIASMSNS